MQMLKLVSISIGVLSLCAMPANAEGAPWCAYKSNGGTYCGYYSWEQCKAGPYGNDRCASNPTAKQRIEGSAADNRPQDQRAPTR